MSAKAKSGFFSVVAIGLGGMIGGSLFGVLGISVELARGATPLAFAIAGIVALLTSYSYAKLTLTYPSPGGTVEFINQAFGISTLTGSANILLWLSYIFLASLYAYALGSYAATFHDPARAGLWRHAYSSAGIAGFAALNCFRFESVSRAQRWIIGMTVCIFLLFIVSGAWSIHAANLRPPAWSDPLSIVAGGMIMFGAYEGFELIGNTESDVRNPRRILPLAYYAAVGSAMFLYFAIAAVAVGNLSVPEITRSRDYALAESARPFLGRGGFLVIVAAAVLSSGAAINATLYGTMRILARAAREGQLPCAFDELPRRIPAGGLLLTAGIALLAVNAFDLSSLSAIGSSGFLLLFAAVNAANARRFAETESLRSLSLIGAAGCCASLAALLWNRWLVSPRELIVFALMLLLSYCIEALYARSAGRNEQLPSKEDLQAGRPGKSGCDGDGPPGSGGG